MFGILTAICVLAVAGIHFYIAKQQWFSWPKVCDGLTVMSEGAVAQTGFLGRSFASYNAAIGVGLIASFGLPADSQTWVQSVVMILIAATAYVGWMGTKDAKKNDENKDTFKPNHKILYARLIPAIATLLFLILS